MDSYKAADIYIDLHGFYPEAAMYRVQKAVETRENLGKSILIVHGYGQGVLRQQVREYLRNSPLVTKVCPGEEFFLPGGGGVTLVFL